MGTGVEMGTDPRRDGDQYYARTGQRALEASSASPTGSGGGGGVRISISWCLRYAVGVTLALVTTFSLRRSPPTLLQRDERKEYNSHARHRRPEIEHPSPRIAPAFGESSLKQNQTIAFKPRDKASRNGGDHAPWVWENAGGKYGLSCDWREGVSTPGSDGGPATIRAEKCAASDKQEQVREILDRRRRIPQDGRVAACVRTKDFGRFLPEWVAFHYVIGVDVIVVNDDDSVDGTREALDPFIRAGVVVYNRVKLQVRKNQMKPLNECLGSFLSRRGEGRNTHAPRWVLLHDTDEFIYPANSSQTIPEMLSRFDASCCLQIKRVQYGSAGYRETPRGLTIENFLTHARDGAGKANRLPKIVLNVEPTSPKLGTVKLPIPSMHGLREGPGSCKCEMMPRSTVRINHYLGSVGDFVDKTRRYWQENHSVDKVEKYMRDRDINEVMTDDIVHWACATREILARAAEGSDLATGELLPSANSSKT